MCIVYSRRGGTRARDKVVSSVIRGVPQKLGVGESSRSHDTCSTRLLRPRLVGMPVRTRVVRTLNNIILLYSVLILVQYYTVYLVYLLYRVW